MTARGYGADWQRIRAAFLQKHPWCSDPFGVHGSELVRAVDVDHKIPLNSGGTNDEMNLDGLCHSCHSRKTAIRDGGFGNRRIDQRGGHE